MMVCVKKGQHDFKPIGGIFEVPWILPSNLAFKWDFSFTESCLYDHQEDDDLKKDWNKGGGVSLSLTNNTKNSALWAWRVSADKRRMQVAPYFNKDSGIIFPEQFIYIEVGQAGSVRIKRKRKQWTVEITNNHTNQTATQTETLKRPWIVKTVGAWFGGYDNDKNGLGGVAPQDMCFFSHFRL